jgi:hypothetical protein
MKVDKGKFDTLLSNILAKPPQKTSEIKGRPKAPASLRLLRSEFCEAQRLESAEPLYCAYENVRIRAVIEAIFKLRQVAMQMLP